MVVPEEADNYPTDRSEINEVRLQVTADDCRLVLLKRASEVMIVVYPGRGRFSCELRQDKKMFCINLLLLWKIGK